MVLVSIIAIVPLLKYSHYYATDFYGHELFHSNSIFLG
jgi:hypothetical protein